MLIKCIKDTEGWWTEGEYYEARVVSGGFALVGDDDEPDGEGWSATPIDNKDDGSIIYALGGINGEVLFEESAV
ncbi:hypothetical protein [Klebsiella grimontii]|uniref:hypothetical protein n=1 Tax=Klebsiella grimontii TaxID=2058152 RepID=UPI0012B8B3C8|nr:hypothetical protein [Klebsiella grimontii]